MNSHTTRTLTLHTHILVQMYMHVCLAVVYKSSSYKCLCKHFLCVSFSLNVVGYFKCALTHEGLKFKQVQPTLFKQHFLVKFFRISEFSHVITGQFKIKDDGMGWMGNNSINFKLMVFSIPQRKCHPVTRCIKKFADQPCYNVTFYLRSRSRRKGMPCVYHLLRSIARSLIFQLHFLSAFFYNKKNS